MDLVFEQIGKVGIFKFSGELTGEHEDTLKIALMRAIHSNDRAVLNFQDVTKIDSTCRQLLRQAYNTSVRLNNPLIMLNLDKNYQATVSGPGGGINSDYVVGGENGHERTSKQAALK